MKFQDVDDVEDGVSVTHSAGAIGVTADAAVDSDKQGIVARVGNWRQETDAGHDDYGAPKNQGLVKIAVTGGSIAAKGSAVEGANYEAGSVEISVSGGVALTSTQEHGIEADLRDVGNAGGMISITQAGAVSAAGDGISAKVARSRAAAAPNRPVIDVDWTGTFTDLEGNPVFRTVARTMEAAQGWRAVKEAKIRFAQGSAGIDAGIMKLQTFMRPGPRATPRIRNAAQMNLLSATHSDSRRADVLREFKAALENVDIAIADEVVTAIGTTAATVDAVTGDEIVQYLGTDDDATRTLLRNVLA